VSRTHIPLKSLMNDSLEDCKIERCNIVREPLNAYVCKESRRDKYKITKHRRIRGREPSRIPVRRVLRKLKKRNTRHRLKCCVSNSFTCTRLLLPVCVRTTRIGSFGITLNIAISNTCPPWWFTFTSVYQHIRMVAVTEMYTAQFHKQNQLLDIVIFRTMAQHW